MSHLLLIGAGYSARYIARTALRAGFHVSMTTRSAPKALKALTDFDTGLCKQVSLIETGYEAAFIPADVTHLCMTAPVSLEVSPSLWKVVSDDILQSSALKGLVYLSTTGVYGDRQGDWTDESAPLAPQSERGLNRVKAEQAWQSLAQAAALPLDILRLTGIYGPGRNSLQGLLNGTARQIIKKDQVFNRIHVEDIAAAVMAALSQQSGTDQRLFNVSDGHPCPPEEVILYAAELLGIPAPQPIPFDTADLSPMARSFYAENKRIDNSKLLSELGLSLNYPDYKSGLDALLSTVKSKE